MWNIIKNITLGLWSFARILVIPVVIIMLLFAILCVVWFFILKYRDGMVMPPSGQVIQKHPGMIKQLLVMVPRRYMLDRFNREEGYFYPRGIHMFCGEQGCGKSIGCVQMMLELQKQYPAAKMITNFGVKSENDELKEWQQLLDYCNGHKGVIVGMDEIQNWFMSGNNQLPEGMLEVATQNRKNNRIICCTAQVFTRVNKGLREQVTMVYNPHTFLGCFTIVVKRKPEFDSEGNVTKLKYRGMYAFTHTDELREAYDTYKVIHTLAKEGFKQKVEAPIYNNTTYQINGQQLNMQRRFGTFRH